MQRKEADKGLKVQHMECHVSTWLSILMQSLDLEYEEEKKKIFGTKANKLAQETTLLQKTAWQSQLVTICCFFSVLQESWRQADY